MPICINSWSFVNSESDDQIWIWKYESYFKTAAILFFKKLTVTSVILLEFVQFVVDVF